MGGGGNGNEMTKQIISRAAIAKFSTGHCATIFCWLVWHMVQSKYKNTKRALFFFFKISCTMQLLLIDRVQCVQREHLVIIQKYKNPEVNRCKIQLPALQQSLHYVKSSHGQNACCISSHSVPASPWQWRFSPPPANNDELLITTKQTSFEKYAMQHNACCISSHSVPTSPWQRRLLPLSANNDELDAQMIVDSTMLISLG